DVTLLSAETGTEGEAERERQRQGAGRDGPRKVGWQRRGGWHRDHLWIFALWRPSQSAAVASGAGAVVSGADGTAFMTRRQPHVSGDATRRGRMCCSSPRRRPPEADPHPVRGGPSRRPAVLLAPAEQPGVVPPLTSNGLPTSAAGNGGACRPRRAGGTALAASGLPPRAPAQRPAGRPPSARSPTHPPSRSLGRSPRR